MQVQIALPWQEQGTAVVRLFGPERLFEREQVFEQAASAVSPAASPAVVLFAAPVHVAVSPVAWPAAEPQYVVVAHVEPPVRVE